MNQTRDCFLVCAIMMARKVERSISRMPQQRRAWQGSADTLAGALGAAAVYPLDYARTRLASDVGVRERHAARVHVRGGLAHYGGALRVADEVAHREDGGLQAERLYLQAPAGVAGDAWYTWDAEQGLCEPDADRRQHVLPTL